MSPREAGPQLGSQGRGEHRPASLDEQCHLVSDDAHVAPSGGEHGETLFVAYAGDAHEGLLHLVEDVWYMLCPGRFGNHVG